MGPLLFPTVFWCDAPEAGLIGAVSLFKFRRIKHLVVATIILDYPWSLLRGTEGSNPSLSVTTKPQEPWHTSISAPCRTPEGCKIGVQRQMRVAWMGYVTTKKGIK